MTIQKSQDHKFRILCLHGIGTNSNVFQAQTASLRYHLGDNYEFDFVDGAYLWPAAPGIEEVFGTQQACYSYFDGTAGSALAAVDDLAAYVVENGPFDAVLGFSMGSALAATLMLQPRDSNDKQLAPTHDAARYLIHSAIFVCGTLPVDCAALRRGTMTWMDAARAHQNCWPVRVPSVHAWSEQDTGYPGQSQQLMRMCVEESRVELLHSAGHGVPSKTDEVAALASSVQKMLSSVRARV